MFDSSDLPPLRTVIEQHGLRAKKSLGQNFLLDQNITSKIVRSAGDLSKKTVFEIGPGPGGLTRSLLETGATQVIAVEFDPRAVQALSGLQHAASGRLQIIEGDALKQNLLTISEGPRAIVANLPYNIATPLLVRWLKQMRSDYHAFTSMTLMFQKEVANRIVASSGSKSYGRLSVIAQWLCDVAIVYNLPPSAFTPPPKVDSAVVHFTPKNLPEDAPNFSDVERITASAFNQRRKMIRSSLRPYLSVIEDLGIAPHKRAENLTIEEFLKIAVRSFKKD